MKQILMTAVGAVLLVGCAGGGGRADETVATTGTLRETAPGPVAPAPVEEEAVVAEVETPADGDDARESVKREADDLLMSRDGRPSWWFGEMAFEGGRARVCGEALGGDMRGARQAAIEAARGRLREEGAALIGERVERAWVWPLQHTDTPGARYAGYVLVSVADD